MGSLILSDLTAQNVETSRERCSHRREAEGVHTELYLKGSKPRSNFYPDVLCKLANKIYKNSLSI